jgi:hypothetical protein
MLSQKREHAAMCTMQLQIANPDCQSTSVKTPQAKRAAPHAEISRFDRRYY